MNLPWQRDRIRPGEQPMACPDCSSTLPASGLEPLANFVPREGRAHGVVTGHKVLCLHCGLVYGVGPSGPFRLMPKVVREQSTNTDEPEKDEYQRPLRPLAREKPRV